MRFVDLRFVAGKLLFRVGARGGGCGGVAAPLIDSHYGAGVTSRRTKLLPPGAPVGRR